MNMAREEQRAGGPGGAFGRRERTAEAQHLVQPPHSGLLPQGHRVAVCFGGTVGFLGQGEGALNNCAATADRHWTRMWGEAASPQVTRHPLGVGGGAFDPAWPGRPAAPGGLWGLLCATGRKPKSGSERKQKPLAVSAPQSVSSSLDDGGGAHWGRKELCVRDPGDGEGLARGDPTSLRHRESFALGRLGPKSFVCVH